ncbi:MAG: DEAD/DEAH box helicase, partial [Candidatus Thioglobus sp.]
MTTENMTTDAAIQQFTNWLSANGLEEKPHQVSGLKWMLAHELNVDEEYLVKGGFLCDQMGMGKTYTALGTLIANPVRNTLIVIPYALITQWSSILTKLFPDFVIYHGKNRTRVNIKDASVVLTTYTTLSHDLLLRSYDVRSICWNRVIFDEAHHMRNKKTATFRGIYSIRAKIKWLVTGTPIQNETNDFINLCRILGLSDGYILEHLDTVVKDFVLKRDLDSTDMELPELRLHTIHTTAGAHELGLSQLIHSRLWAKRPLHYGAILPMFMKARQACVMPQMLDSFCSNVKKDVDADGSGNEREFPECINNVLGNSETVFEGDYLNSKVEQVVNFIKERKGNGRSKLVFSHFHDEIDLIKEKLEEDGMCVATFDGRVPADKRRPVLTDNSVDALI